MLHTRLRCTKGYVVEQLDQVEPEGQRVARCWTSVRDAEDFQAWIECAGAMKASVGEAR